MGRAADAKYQMACAFSGRRPRRAWVTAGGGGCAKNVGRGADEICEDIGENPNRGEEAAYLTWVHVRSLFDPRIRRRLSGYSDGFQVTFV